MVDAERASEGGIPVSAGHSSGNGDLLSVDGLSVSFGAVKAVDEVAFEVGHGELFAVIGPNGAGKTTILNCLSGLCRPNAGSIRFDGRELAGRPPEQIATAGVGRTFQNIELFEALSVLDNLLLGRHARMGYGPLRSLVFSPRARREERRHRRRVEEIIDFLELEAYRQQPVASLAYGVQKRVELGRALASEPRLLLLDEPVAGMNREETEDMARYILDVQESLDVTIVLIDHHMGLVMDLADRILVVDFGQPVALGTPAQIQSNPDVIRVYMGGERSSATADSTQEG